MRERRRKEESVYYFPPPVQFFGLELDVMEADASKGPHWLGEFQRLAGKSTPAPAPPGPPPASPAAADRRRRHARFRPEDARIQVTPDGLLAAIGVGRENLAREPLDLSEGGAKVLLSRRLGVGAKVLVRIEIDKFADALSASGVVRWCHQSAKNPSDFFAGIMFTDLAPAEAKKIAAMRDWFTSSKCIKLRRMKARQSEDLF